MKLTKIVYISYVPLSNKIYNEFYFQELINNGYTVEYWDITQLFFKSTLFDDSNRVEDFDNTEKFETYAALKKKFKTQEDDVIYVSIITFEWRAIRLHYLLKKYNCKVAFFSRGMLPLPGIESFNSISEKITRFQVKYIFRSLKAFLALTVKNLGLVKTLDYVFVAGNYGHMVIGTGNKMDMQNAKKVIRINSLDYDFFLKNKRLIENGNKKYTVFIDEYLPYHSDFLLFNMKTIDAENYYEQLNAFFSKIEKEFDTEVVIAAHPKASKYRLENPFKNRKILFEQTCQLCANADFVIGHASTAIFYGAMFNKRCIFLYSDEFKSIHPHLYLTAKQYAVELDAPLIDMGHFDNDFQKIDFLAENKKRQELLYNYLTSSESQNTLTCDIFVNFLKENNF